ncbi:MAG: SAP domain-containing protein [Ardenticatenaceae bacterium]|nr:SAP domain-containing protein [Ardenticatenaceae bacterium]MCB9446181.1 SAP domain-containing protein [Ardenticatenaceae bacterium]
MAVGAFVYRNEVEGFEFAEAFLKSPDLDFPTLKNICRDLGFSVGGKKQDLINRIISLLERQNQEVCQLIIEHLVLRQKSFGT